MDFFHFRVKRFLDRNYFRFKALTAHFLALGAKFVFYFNKTLSLKMSMASNRIYLNHSSIAFVKKNWSVLENNLESLVSQGVPLESAAQRSIVIKWPDITEQNIIKGILIITFTKTSSFYFWNINRKELCRYFHVVLEPSWSGYMDADILFWAFSSNAPVWVQATEIKDRALLDSLATNLIPLSFGASDWVSYQEFSNLLSDKIYDSAYVANTNPIKRVYRYLVAVKNLVEKGHHDYKGLLICAAWGGKKEAVQNMVKRFKLEDNLELRFSLNKEELIKVLNQSKVNLLLSFKEGSNRSLFESMFCNIPVITLVENVGSNKAYINEYTGLLIMDEFLESALLYMRDNYTKFSPRSWALKNITPERTTEKIVEVIGLRDELFESNSLDSAYVKVNNPEVSYLHCERNIHKEINADLLKMFSLNVHTENKSEKINQLKERFVKSFSCSKE